MVFRAGERMLMRAGARPCTIHLIASELGVSETAMRPIVERSQAWRHFDRIGGLVIVR